MKIGLELEQRRSLDECMLLGRLQIPKIASNRVCGMNQIIPSSAFCFIKVEVGVLWLYNPAVLAEFPFPLS